MADGDWLSACTNCPECAQFAAMRDAAKNQADSLRSNDLPRLQHQMEVALTQAQRMVDLAASAQAQADATYVSALNALQAAQQQMVQLTGQLSAPAGAAGGDVSLSAKPGWIEVTVGATKVWTRNAETAKEISGALTVAGTQAAIQMAQARLDQAGSQLQDANQRLADAQADFDRVKQIWQDQIDELIGRINDLLEKEAEYDHEYKECCWNCHQKNRKAAVHVLVAVAAAFGITLIVVGGPFASGGQQVNAATPATPATTTTVAVHATAPTTAPTSTGVALAGGGFCIIDEGATSLIQTRLVTSPSVTQRWTGTIMMAGGGLISGFGEVINGVGTVGFTISQFGTFSGLTLTDANGNPVNLGPLSSALPFTVSSDSQPCVLVGNTAGISGVTMPSEPPLPPTESSTTTTSSSTTTTSSTITTTSGGGGGGGGGGTQSNPKAAQPGLGGTAPVDAGTITAGHGPDVGLIAVGGVLVAGAGLGLGLGRAGTAERPKEPDGDGEGPDEEDEEDTPGPGGAGAPGTVATDAGPVTGDIDDQIIEGARRSGYARPLTDHVPSRPADEHPHTVERPGTGDDHAVPADPTQRTGESGPIGLSDEDTRRLQRGMGQKTTAHDGMSGVHVHGEEFHDDPDAYATLDKDEKLMAALVQAVKSGQLSDEILNSLEQLLSPEGLAGLAFFTGALVAANVLGGPFAWVFEGGAMLVLYLAVGESIIDLCSVLLNDVWDAKNKRQFDAAVHKLAQVLGGLGSTFIQIFTATILGFAGKKVKEAIKGKPEPTVEKVPSASGSTEGGPPEPTDDPSASGEHEGTGGAGGRGGRGGASRERPLKGGEHPTLRPEEPPPEQPQPTPQATKRPPRAKRRFTGGSYKALPVDRATAERVVVDMTKGINDPWPGEVKWTKKPHDWGPDRGYKVARDINCPWTALEFAERWRGGHGPFSKGAPSSPTVGRGYALLETYFKSRFFNTSRSAIVDLLKAKGDGAQVVVRVRWKNGGKHLFNAVNYQGHVIFVDAQTGSLFPDSDWARVDWTTAMEVPPR